MKMLASFAMAVAGLAAPLLLTAPLEAKTAFQYWAQGRGAYVPSKERLSTYQDDLNALGLVESPPPGYWRRRDQRQNEWRGPGED